MRRSTKMNMRKMKYNRDNRLRFHLAVGPNHMKWQLRNKKEGILEYYNPDEFTYSIHNGKLNNSQKVAQQIFDGSNKTVCSWISFGSGSQDVSDFNRQPTIRISYNPRLKPYWTAWDYDECNLDGFEGNMYIINKSVYVIKEELELFFKTQRSEYSGLPSVKFYSI
jgi:hypothetical protein